MTAPRPDRRRFLRRLAAGAVAAPVLARFEAVEAAVGGELRRSAAGAGGSLRPEVLRERYLLDPAVTYLNHASIGTMPAVVTRALGGYLEACESNPWLHVWGDAWTEALQSVRAAAARLLRCQPDDVALTHNTTEGFNLFARGLPLGPGDEVLFSSLNHAGASVCWEHVASERGFTVRRFDFPWREAGAMGPDEVVDVHLREIRPGTRVLVFPHVDNTVGLRHPLGALASAARRAGVEWVLADGAQTAGMIPLDLPSSEVDGYAMSPHKWVQSPKGTGMLYLSPRLRERLDPMWVTWGLRTFAGTVRVFEDYGTRDLPQVLALGDALDFQASLGEGAKEERLRELHARMRRRVEASPDLEWLSPRRWSNGASLVAVRVRGRRAPDLAAALYRERGVVVRGFGGDVDALRVSPNVVTTEEELDRFFDLVEAA